MTYDRREMANDAMTGAAPPLHTGLKSFVSDEGVYALAEALRDSVGRESQEDRIEALEKERDDLRYDNADLEERLKRATNDLNDANKKITEALECLQ